MLKVWNKRDKNTPDNAVYIGRGSPWGNPFTHIKGPTLAKFIVETREQSINEFKDWLTIKNPHLIKHVKNKLRGKDLICFCAPLPCHGDVLLAIANCERDCGMCIECYEDELNNIANEKA